MATDTDLVASKAAALRLAKRMGCTGAHQHPDGKWMPCSTMEEYEKLKKTQPDSEKNSVEIIESRRRYRNSKGKNKREGWERLGERGLTSIDTISGGGLVGGRSGSIKVAGGWAPDDEDPDVFTNARSARRRARQLGCIGVARRTSRAGKTVWTPCSNMTDYAKRTGSTAFGRNFQRRRARRTLERAVASEVRRQLRRKKSLMEVLYEDKALGQKLRRARIALTTPFNPDARDADMDMLVQEGTPWERPARPRIPQIGTNRAGRRRAERGADRRERRRDLSQPQRRQSPQETARTAAREWRRLMTGKRPTTTDDERGYASQRYEFSKRFPGYASERHESVEELRKEILDRVGEEHRNKDHREVHFVFGPPGSGKTSRVDDGTLHVPGKGEAAHTDPDIYKPYDRAWNDGEGADVAHGPSRWESKKTIREAEKLGMDVVVQGTGKDGQLISELVYIDGQFEKGRQQNVTSIMHFVWATDRDTRIFDRGVNRGPDDQRRRFGTDPRTTAEIRSRVTKYIEEGRLDEFYIYDNDVGPDESPPVIASFLDGALVIHDDDKFDEIFTETDADGNPVLLTPGGYISPGLYALSDDPRVGKTHAQRIRDFGDDPGAYREYDEKKRKAIADGTREPSKRGHGLRGNLTEEEARIAESLGYNQEWRDRMRALDRGEDPDAEEPFRYRGIHEAPTKDTDGAGDTLDDLSNVMPLHDIEPGNAVQRLVELYGYRGADPEYERANEEMIEALTLATNDPDAPITVYRAIPFGEPYEIEPGDWVTPSESYAAIHGEGPMRGDYEIIDTEVRAGDLVSEGNSLYEYGWDPNPRDPDDPPMGLSSERSLGDEYRMAQKARGWASQRGESFEDRYGEETPQGEGDCFVASVKAGRELEAAGVDNHGNPISNVRIVHGAPLGVGGDAEGLRYPHAWIEYDVETPEPVFHRDLLDPEVQKQILERIPDDKRKEFMELIRVAQRFEQQIKDGESGLFDQLGVPRSGKRTMIRDYSNTKNDSGEFEPYVNIDRKKLLAERPDFDKEWYYERGSITDDDILGEFSLDEMETLQEEFGISDYGRDEADDLLGDLDPQGRPKISLGEYPEEAEARRRTQGQVNQQVRRNMGYESSREELTSADGPLVEMFPDSTERERSYLAHQLLAGGQEERVPQEVWDTFVRLVEEEHPGIMERIDAVSRTLETADGFKRLTQSGLISAPGIVNGIDPGQIGDPVTLYHAGHVDLRQADGTFAGKARQQFGPGVYTASEAFTVIDGWARPKRGADGIQTGQPGYLHTLKWTGDGSPRILDMEEPLPDDLLDLALDHLHDLNRFVAAADPVGERPSTPDEIADHGDDSTWTMDEYRIHVRDELVESINYTIERIRRSREQGRTQQTGREILGPNEGLADMFKLIEITPDGIINMDGNPDGWVKSAIVDRMRTKLNNALMEAGYDVLRAKDVRREEFMFLDPSKVEFVDSAKISSMDPFGTDSSYYLRQILGEEVDRRRGFGSAREPSVGRGRPLRDERGRSIDRVFDPNADYTSEDLKEWTMLELRNTAKSLDVPFAGKAKKKLIEDILKRRRRKAPRGGRGPTNAKPSPLQQWEMLRNQLHNAEKVGDQDEIDRIKRKLRRLPWTPGRGGEGPRGLSSEREEPEFLHLLSTLSSYEHLSELTDGVFIDPAVIPEDPVGEARVHARRLIEIAGEAQMEKLRNANPDVPDDKLYRLAREVDPLLGNDPGVAGERSFHWGNDSKISVGMKNLPDDALDRVTRRFLKEFDRRAEVERLRTERDPKTQQPLRLGGLTDKEIEAQLRLQRRSKFQIELGLEDTGPWKYDRDYLNRLAAEKAAREKRDDWTTPDLPKGFASERTDPPPPPEDVIFRTEKFWGEPNLIVAEPSGSQWVKAPDGSYARFSTRPEGTGTGDVFVEPLSGWHSPRKYVFATEKVAHTAQVTGIPPEDKDVSPVPKVGLHALSMGPTPEQTHVSDRIVEVPRRRPTIPMKTQERGLESSRDASQRKIGKIFEGVSTDDLVAEQRYIRGLNVGGINPGGYAAGQYYGPRVREDVEAMEKAYGREDLMARRLKQIQEELELRGWDDIFRGEGTRREEIRDMSIRQLRNSDVHPDVYEPVENTFYGWPDDDPIWDMSMREIAKIDQGSGNLYFSDRDIDRMIDTDANYRGGTPGTPRGPRGMESSREDDSDDNVVDAGDRFTQWQRKPGETREEYIYRRAEEDPEWAKRFRETLLGADPEEEPSGEGEPDKDDPPPFKQGGGLTISPEAIASLQETSRRQQEREEQAWADHQTTAEAAHAARQAAYEAMTPEEQVADDAARAPKPPLQVQSAADVTDEIIEAADDMAWEDDQGNIDWERTFDRIDGLRSEDGQEWLFPDQLDDPVFEKIKRGVRKRRRETR